MDNYISRPKTSRVSKLMQLQLTSNKQILRLPKSNTLFPLPLVSCLSVPLFFFFLLGCPLSLVPPYLYLFSLLAAPYLLSLPTSYLFSFLAAPPSCLSLPLFTFLLGCPLPLVSPYLLFIFPLGCPLPLVPP